jgi:hypothetical protein
MPLTRLHTNRRCNQPTSVKHHHVSGYMLHTIMSPVYEHGRSAQQKRQRLEWILFVTLFLLMPMAGIALVVVAFLECAI